MFLRIARKIFARHLTLHLVIPLVVGLLAESSLAWWRCKKDCNPFLGYLLTPERGGFFIVSFVAYLAVMYVILWRETKKGLRRLGQGVLEEVLKDAKSYFAVGTIKLTEWFEPSVEVYLATLIRRKLEAYQFQHDRVLIFFTRGQIKDLNSQYLDGYYAKAFIEIHKLSGIGLGYLEPPQVSKILKTLSIEERMTVGYYPSWPRWLFNDSDVQWLLKKSHWILNKVRKRKLAFAFVELRNGTRCVLAFSKHGERIGLTRIDDAGMISHYEKLVVLIKGFTYVSGPPYLSIRADRDFTKFYQ